MTVLELHTPEPHDRAVQWRQIVELLARGGKTLDAALRRRALTRLAEVSPEVPVAVRAAAARSIAGPGVPAPLIALFAADTAGVAAPLLTAATISPADWDTVRAAASPGVRSLLSALRPVPHDAEAAIEPEPEPEPVVEPSEPAVSIMSTESSRAVVPSLLLVEPGLFRWECGSGGAIDWVEGVPRAAVIGSNVADMLPSRFEARLPFSDHALAVMETGPLMGEWRWTGTPAFAPGSGRFIGYRGIARRDGDTAPVAPAKPADIDPDSLRELVHELRTPLNAIIGFGEIIDGQFLGPANGAYRTRASEIVRQGRLLLSAVEDLDFAAKLQSGRMPAGQGASAEELLPKLRDRLSEQSARRGIALTVSVRGPGGRLVLDPALAERLVGRFAGAIVDSASAGERLQLSMERSGARMAVAIDRPNATRGLNASDMLDPTLDVGHPDGLGPEFALRLVRGLAGLAGGALEFTRDRIILWLPAHRN